MIPHSQKLNQCEYVIINRAVVTVYYLQSKTNLNYDQILLNVKYKLFLFPVFCMSKLFSLFSFKKKKKNQEMLESLFQMKSFPSNVEKGVYCYIHCMPIKLKV